MPRPAIARRHVRQRWAARAALGLAISTAMVTATGGTGAADTLPPPAPMLVEQGTQLLQAVNGAVTQAATDPTLDLVVCLFTEAQTQLNRLATGAFDLGYALDGFVSCFTAYGEGGHPNVNIPGPDVGSHVGLLTPGQVTDRPFVAPAAGTVSSSFGSRWGTTHYGTDIAAGKGTPIVSVAPGKVISSGPASGFGRWVRVEHDDGTITVYGHNQANAVSVGQRVRTNQIIAYVGSEGDSTGPHLHFEVRAPGTYVAVDPVPWLRARGVPVVVD